jgi:16S rRNA (uracil1498-N3)-methyltransferase
MTVSLPKVRLFVEAELGPGRLVEPSRDQSHYLVNVMRLGRGDTVGLFNGRDGEWRAELTAAGRSAALVCAERVRRQRIPPDLWLLFAPIKKARTDFIVEKATELGAARLQPVFTRFTNAERLRPDRLRAHAIEAAEQCGETHVPEVAEPLRLATLLDGWDPARRILFCDETLAARPAAEALADAASAGAPPGPWAVLTGPEGGFAPEEAERLRALPFVLPVTLGPRILRADTAAVAALTLWQSALGDWKA